MARSRRLEELAKTDTQGEGTSYWGLSPHGNRIAIVGNFADTVRKVWEAESGKELLTLRGHSHKIFGVAFSLDGKRLATSS